MPAGLVKIKAPESRPAGRLKQKKAFRRKEESIWTTPDHWNSFVVSLQWPGVRLYTISLHGLEVHADLESCLTRPPASGLADSGI